MRKFAEFYNTYFEGIRKFTNDELYGAEIIPFEKGEYVIKAGVICLNSCWFSMNDQDEHNLWVGERVCNDAFNQIKGCGGSDFNIVLLHHPLSWLHNGEQEIIKNKIVANADVLLHGHMHNVETKIEISPPGKLLMLQAGLMHSAKQDPKIFRALVGKLDLQDSGMYVKAIKYNNSKEKWVADSDNEFSENFWKLFNKAKVLKPNIDIPIIIYSMKRDEAELLRDSGIASFNESSKEDVEFFKIFQENFLDSEMNLSSNYSSSRNEWKPSFLSEGSIKKLLETLIIDSSIENPTLEIPQVTYFSDDFIEERDIDDQAQLWEKLRGSGGIIIIDSTSLFHPQLKKKLMKCHAISCKNLNILIVPPIDFSYVFSWPVLRLAFVDCPSPSVPKLPVSS